MNLAPNWKVIFTQRKANHIAHVLAKYACNVGGGDLIWVEFPAIIYNILMEEKISIVNHNE